MAVMRPVPPVHSMQGPAACRIDMGSAARVSCAMSHSCRALIGAPFWHELWVLPRACDSSVFYFVSHSTRITAAAAAVA